MENLEILVFYEDKTSAFILLDNGELSEEFLYMENALVYLNTFLKENNYSPDAKKILFNQLLIEGELPTLYKEELTCLFLVYLINDDLSVELDKYHLRNGLFLVEVPGSLKYQFVGLDYLNKKKISLSPEFLYRYEVYEFMDFLYNGGLLNNRRLKFFEDYIKTITIFTDDFFGGSKLSQQENLEKFIPYWEE